MDYDLLLKAPLFKGMDINEINSLLGESKYRIRRFKTGTLIAQSGDIIDRLLIVASGTVKGEMTDYAGRIIKIEDIPAPGALAPAFMFGSRNRFPVNVIALTDVEILEIGKGDFLRIMRKSDRLLINFLDIVSNRSQFLSEKIKFLNFKTIKGKLAQMILHKTGDMSTSLRLDMTQNDLADFFGVARPSVARALGELEKEGYITADGRSITILDRKKLAGLTSD